MHGELEQAQEWRLTTENLNKELKKQLDELKDHLDNEVTQIQNYALRVLNPVLQTYVNLIYMKLKLSNTFTYFFV